MPGTTAAARPGRSSRTGPGGRRRCRGRPTPHTRRAAAAHHSASREVFPQPAGASSTVSRCAVGRSRCTRPGRGSRPRRAGGCSFVASSTGSSSTRRGTPAVTTAACRSPATRNSPADEVFANRQKSGDRPYLGPGDGPRGVDQADVAERLREVAEQVTGVRVDLLGEQPHVVDVADGPLEHRRGPGRPDRPRPAPGPARTCRAGTCPPRRRGRRRSPALGAVAVDQPARVGEPLRDGLDRGDHPRVVGREEPDEADHQVGRVEVGEPNDWVNDFAVSFHPSVRIAARISSAAARHAGTRSVGAQRARRVRWPGRARPST